MAKFTSAQAADVAAIQQVINEWGDELDRNDGLKLAEADVLTTDCRYNVGGEWREGLAGAAKFYADRKVRLAAAGGVPVMRHLMMNYKVRFTGETTAEADFMLLFFAAVGTPPFDTCDPAAVAEVRMEMRREGDGHWRIASFDSGQTFRRV